MGLFDKIFKKNDGLIKCDKTMWQDTAPRNFPMNFIKRYNALFDIEDLGFNQYKDVIYSEMLELTAVWLTLYPDDANAVFSGIIVLSENYSDFTKTDVNKANAYSLAVSGDAILYQRKEWFKSKAYDIVNGNNNKMKKFVDDASSSNEKWFFENREEIISGLSKYIEKHY